MKFFKTIFLFFIVTQPIMGMAQTLVPLVGAKAQTSVALADRIIAIVNEDAITLSELRTKVDATERQLRGHGTSLPSRSILEKQILERMITDRIQLQMAKESAIQVDDTQIDAILQKIAESNQVTLHQFREMLIRDGVSWNRFREEIRDEVIITRMKDREVDSRIHVTEGEIDNYLENHRSMPSGSDEVNVAHILLRVSEQSTPDQLLRVQSRAEQALSMLKDGGEFAGVAASFSDAPDAMSGGILGLRPMDRLPSLYADAVQNLSPGEISPIFRSSAGFHIIKLIDRRTNNGKQPALTQTNARHILIKVSELTPETEAKRKILSIKEQINNGMDFSEAARLYSNDLSASKGGDLGWLYQGDTVPEFEQAMNALHPNEISLPVRTQFGFHLIQVIDRRSESATTERQRQMARQTLRESRVDENYQDWLRQIRDRAYVEIRLQDQ